MTVLVFRITPTSGNWAKQYCIKIFTQMKLQSINQRVAGTQVLVTRETLNQLPIFTLVVQLDAKQLQTSIAEIISDSI